MKAILILAALTGGADPDRPPKAPPVTVDDRLSALEKRVAELEVRALRAGTPTAKPAGGTLTIGGVPHELRGDGCYWPLAPGVLPRPAAFVVDAPAVWPTLATYAAPVSGSCPGGQCAAPARSSAPRGFAFPRK